MLTKTRNWKNKQTKNKKRDLKDKTKQKTPKKTEIIDEKKPFQM